jgi:hypothetical protein
MVAEHASMRPMANVRRVLDAVMGTAVYALILNDL